MEFSLKNAFGGKLKSGFISEMVGGGIYDNGTSKIGDVSLDDENQYDEPLKNGELENFIKALDLDEESNKFLLSKGD
ncbi:hypothetical protein ThvES_00010930 [Thiovulum sp. ES]|nr:hypothetical protein ThvES_00010930 [Thiovulum sp. ES]